MAEYGFDKEAFWDRDGPVTDDMMREDKPSHKLAAEATSRRITANNQHLFDGGYVFNPNPTTPKIAHKVVFESAGSKFTVAELAAAFTRLPLAAKASEVSIKSWGQHFNPTGVHAEKDAQVAIIEWEE